MHVLICFKNLGGQLAVPRWKDALQTVAYSQGAGITRYDVINHQLLMSKTGD